ncbi:MAG: DNA polymerase III subunit delta' [Gammaproteobacteria bacterium]|nr:MAG: DNA polymerase III subunit delta' [Gammaproteobacteria bacterium]
MTLAPWNAEAWTRLIERRRHDALPHALLLAGPAGLGKREFADGFAQALLCQSTRADGSACGACRACQLFAAGTHPDLVRVNLELRDDGKPRTEITVDQMRMLSERLVLTAQFGGMQIALIDPADAMNVSASNALLKTLEEPTSRTMLMLIGDHPARLSATIRSRCQRIEFRLPPSETAQRWLSARDIDAKAAQDALLASDGNPGRALAWARSGALKLRREVAQDLRDLAAGSASAYEVAQRWSKDGVDLRLHFAAALVREAAQAQARGRARDAALALTHATEMSKLTAWFDRANRTRELLRGPLRPELALLELLAAWTTPAAA